MPANTQNFRVKHGLEVTESAAFSNTITIAGNTTVNAAIIISNEGSAAVNAIGKSYFSNTVAIANGGLTVNAYSTTSTEGFRVTAANSSSSQSLVVNTSQVYISGNLVVTGVVSSQGTENLSIGTGDIILLSGVQGSPVTNASITVTRGTSSTVKILWDETNDTWKFTNDGIYYYPFRTYSSLVYSFDTNTTTAADPGNGKIRFNNSTYASVTEIAIDLLEFGGTSVSTLLQTLDDSSSVDKALLLFRSAENPSKFVSYKLSTSIITATTGVLRFPVTYIAGGGSAFSANEIIFLEYSVVGDKGAQGFQGNQGFQGSQGFQGAQGNQGFQGAQGFQGNQGFQGLQGAQGSTGSQGSQGSNGTNGSQGPQGTQGSTGPQGTTGAQGPQGYQGNQGYQGQAITGPQGPQGPQGATGPQGAQGNQGFQGTQGINGGTGPQGSQGAQGAQGRQGTAGSNGGTGPQGFQGAQGFQGNQGYQGAFSTNTSAQVDSLGVGTPATGAQGEIRATDNITAYYSSDIRFKENVTDIENALAIAAAIGGKTFDWSDSYIKSRGGNDGYFVTKHDVGVIAQDVQRVCPELVRTRPDGSLAVDYTKLVAIALAAIKELSIEIDLLKK